MVNKKYVSIFCVVIVIFGILFSSLIYFNYRYIKQVSVSDLYITDSVSFSVDTIDESDDEHIFISGWAALLGEDIKIVQCYVSLMNTSNDKLYQVNTQQVNRNGVTEQINDGFNYDLSGYSATITKKSIEQGQYEVCLIYKNNGVNLLVKTNRYIDIIY